MLCDKRDEAMAVTRRAANHESSHCQAVIGQMEMSAEEGEKASLEVWRWTSSASVLTGQFSGNPDASGWQSMTVDDSG
jgi:hypothetical protein